MLEVLLACSCCMWSQIQVGRIEKQGWLHIGRLDGARQQLLAHREAGGRVRAGTGPGIHQASGLAQPRGAALAIARPPGRQAWPTKLIVITTPCSARQLTEFVGHCNRCHRPFGQMPLGLSAVPSVVIHAPAGSGRPSSRNCRAQKMRAPPNPKLTTGRVFGGAVASCAMNSCAWACFTPSTKTCAMLGDFDSSASGFTRTALNCSKRGQVLHRGNTRIHGV